MRYWLLLLMCCLLLGPLCSTAQVTLRGTITDEQNGEALPGANVRLQTDWRSGTASDAEGAFSLSTAAGRGDTVIISFIGYLPERHYWDQQSDLELQVQLVPKGGQLAEVVVAAPRLVAAEFSVSQIKKLAIYKNPAAKADPLLAVNSLPAATTTDESASVSLRGSSPAETGIFLDGVPIYDAVKFAQLNGLGTFSIFNTSIIEDLHVFPGNPPLEYGNTTAGLIALETEDQVPEGPSRELALTLANVSAAASLPAGAQGGIRFFANVQDGALFRQLNKASLPDLERFALLDGGVQYVRQMADRLKLKVFHYQISEAYRFAYRAPSHSGRFIQDTRRHFTVASLRRSLPQGMLDLQAGFSRGRRELTDEHLLDFSLLSTDYYLGINHLWEQGMLSIKSGLSIDHREQETEGRFPVLAFAGRRDHPAIQLAETQSRSSAEAFVYAKRELGSQWLLGLVYRKNLPIGVVPSYHSGQLSLRRELAHKQVLRLGAGQYHHYVLPGNGQTNAGLIRSRQLSLDYSGEHKALSWQASLFAKESRLPDSQQQLTGAELFVAYQAGTKLSGSLALTSMFAQLEGTEQAQKSPYDLPVFAKLQGNYAFLPGWDLSLVAVLRSGLWDAPISEARFVPEFDVWEPLGTGAFDRLPGYQKVDLNLSYRWTKKEQVWIAFMNVNNLLNQANTRQFSYAADYSSREHELFSLRSVYFGIICRW